MSGEKPSIPNLRHHKGSGQAAVVLDGRWHYLGRYGTPEAREAYDRLVSEWLQHGRQVPTVEDELAVAELILAYWRFAGAYYLDGDGQPTKELSAIRCAMRPLRKLYGTTPAAQFGPLAFKTVRQAFIDNGLCRSKVNEQTGRIKRMFKWATSNELVPPSVYHGLQSVDGLKRGRTAAREPRKITPVPEAYVDAVLPHVSRQVAAMIRLQLLTGMRSGEVTTMRVGDISSTGRLWVYTPQRHKTERFAIAREVYLGPQAQAIVREFLKPDTKAYLFSPADAEAERDAQRRRDRRTPMTPSQAGRRPKRYLSLSRTPSALMRKELRASPRSV